jgi:hypothetical protein
MFRQSSTLLVLAALSILGACDDEIVADAVPGKDAASDQTSDAAKEGGKGDASGAVDAGAVDAAAVDAAAVDAAVEDSAPDAETDASDAPLE